MALHGAHRLDRVFKLRTGFVEIIPAEPHGQRQIFWPDRAHRINRFQMKAHPVCEAAALGILPLTMRRGCDDLNEAGTQFEDA
ncbi:MAG: hypothetical protein ACKOC9_10035, partial [Alphaproteobacteria bacterium]